MVNPANIFPSYLSPLIWGLLLLVTIIIVVRVWLAVRYRDRSASNAVDVSQDVSVIQRPILTASEVKFFRVLHDAVGTQYIIFPQLSLWTMIDSQSTDRKTSTIFRNQISLKRVDFVLADPTTLRPYMVIELDDRSHEREDRRKRDAFVKMVLDRAGIKLIRIPVASSYESQTLRSRLGLTVLEDLSA